MLNFSRIRSQQRSRSVSLGETIYCFSLLPVPQIICNIWFICVGNNRNGLCGPKEERQLCRENTLVCFPDCTLHIYAQAISHFQYSKCGKFTINLYNWFKLHINRETLSVCSRKNYFIICIGEWKMGFFFVSSSSLFVKTELCTF